MLPSTFAFVAEQRHSGGALDETVSDVYYSVETGEVRVKGVCDAFRPELVCWDSDGHLSSELAKQALEELKSAGKHNGLGYADIPFVFRQKNRLLVLESPNYEKSVGSFSGIETGENVYPNLLNPYREPTQERRVSLYPIHVPPTRTTFDFTARFFVPLPGKSAINAKAGATAKIGSYRISIGEFAKTPDSMLMPYISGPNWSAPITVDAGPNPSRIQVMLSPLDEQGHLVTNVDAAGKPIPSKMPLTGPSYPFNPLGPRYVLASVMNRDNNSVKSSYLQTNVKLSEISSFTLTLATDRYVKFTKVPLDPIQ